MTNKLLSDMNIDSYNTNVVKNDKDSKGKNVELEKNDGRSDREKNSLNPTIAYPNSTSHMEEQEDIDEGIEKE